MSETKLEAHVVDLDVKHVSMSYGDTSIMSHSEYAWVCSCGERGDWIRNVRSARTGGQRHVAAMERGR